MTNSDISAVFRAIGALLQIRGEDSFRARIYDQAADIIEEFPDEFAAPDPPGYNRDAVEKLRATRGIGKAIQEKTVEMLETGRCKFYDELAAEIGTDILELLKLRGIGVKTVGRFYRDLGVRTLDDLRSLIESGEIQRVKGIGRKTLQMLTESLEFHTAQRNKRPLWSLVPIAENLSEQLTHLLNTGWIQRFQFTGDLRRHEEVCSRTEVIWVCEDETAFQFGTGNLPAPLQTFLEPFSQTGIRFQLTNQQQYAYDNGTLVERGPRERTGDLRDTLPIIQLQVDGDFPVSIYLCTPATAQAVLFLTTAAPAHANALLLESSGGFWRETAGMTETEIYETFGLPYIPPELRQDADSVAAARAGELPDLVELTDLRGDLHAHTDWSDGRHTLQEMAAAAQAAGLAYFAVTDHSVSSTVANGLDRQRLLEQIRRVRELDAALEGLTLLAGSEVDIRRHGDLDFPDSILEQLDIVVASVHSHFTLTETEMTDRIVRAIENPFVNIIGHPTGRMLGRRDMYPVNLEAIIEAAAANNTALEINGSPHRLDLDPKYVRMAKKAGVRLAVNTDAHAIRQLEHRQSGINVARRGWLTKADVINTYTLEDLRETCNIGPRV